MDPLEENKEEKPDDERTDTEEEITEEEQENDHRGDDIEQLRAEFQSGLDSLRSEIQGLVTGITEELAQLRSELASISERTGPGPEPTRDERPRPKGFWWRSLIEEI